MLKLDLATLEEHPALFSWSHLATVLEVFNLDAVESINFRNLPRSYTGVSMWVNLPIAPILSTCAFLFFFHFLGYCGSSRLKLGKDWEGKGYIHMFLLTDIVMCWHQHSVEYTPFIEFLETSHPITEICSLAVHLDNGK